MRRDTSLFFDADEKIRIYIRCDLLLQGCPRCSQPAATYLPNARDILENFKNHPSLTATKKEKESKEVWNAKIKAWTAKSPIAKVYDRVNTIKHHKKPDKDIVSDLNTAERWKGTSSALCDLAVLMQDLIKHWALCVNESETLTP